MPQVLRTNIYSLNTQRQLDRSQSGLATALERLSSGYRINSAKDDAAGLAISERMSAQISGLNVARRNANDGVSLSQTAESAISTIGEMLRRMRDLAVQSANATNSDSDRVALQEEVVQLKMEIERIGTDTNYNGRKLLDGSFTNQYFQIGANAGQVTIVNLTDSRASAMGAQFSSETKEFSFNMGTPGSAAAPHPGPLNGSEYQFDLSGVRVTVKQTAVTGDYSDIKNEINKLSMQTNVRADFKDPADPFSGLILKGAAFDMGNFQARLADGTPDTVYPRIEPQLVGAYPVGPMNNVAAAKNAMNAQTLSVYGSVGTEHIRIEEGESAKSIADTINRLEPVTGVAASAKTVCYLAELEGDGVVGFKLFGSNEAAINVSAEVEAGDLTNLAKAINDLSDKTGVTAELSLDKTEIKLQCEDGYDIAIEDFNNSNTAQPGVVVRGPTSVGTMANPGDPVGTQIRLDGTNADQDSFRIGGRVYFHSEQSFRLETTEDPTAVRTWPATVTNIPQPLDPNVQGAGSGSLLADEKVYPSTISISNIDISTREGANTAIISIDAALTRINSNRAKLGAVQSRFDNAIANLQTVAENLSSARSRILDADYASETASMASSQIIQQAGIAMLTQANALPQNVLSLLQG